MTSHTVAIVVLGARVLPDGRPSAALQRRLERTADAWLQQTAPLVVCSGGRCWNGFVEAAVMRDVLISLGVKPQSILLETASLSTADNARYTAALLSREGVRSAVLVTNHWHLRRALADFRLCGVEATPLGAQSAPSTPGRRALRYAFERVCEHMDRTRLRRAS